MISSIAPKTSTFCDLKTCLRSKTLHSRSLLLRDNVPYSLLSTHSELLRLVHLHSQNMQFFWPTCAPSDPRLPIVRFDSIIVLTDGRRRCFGLDGVGFAASNEDLAFRVGVCYLMNLFLRTMFKLRQGPVQFLGLFFGH